MKKIVLYISILFLFVSCSSTAWISSPGSIFPEEKYLYALGYGDTREEADQDARRNLADRLGMSVRTEARSNTTVSTVYDSRNEGSEVYRDYFESIIESRVDPRTFYGLEIAKRGKKAHGIVSLAVVDRAATARYYWSELEKIGQKAEALEALLGAGSPLSNLSKAVKYAKVVAEYNNMAVLYSYISGREASLMDMNGAYSAAVDARSRILVSLKVEGDVNSMVLSQMEKILSEEGFAVAYGDAPANATCIAKVDWVEYAGAGIAAGFVFEQYNASVVFSDDLDNDVVIYEYHTSGKDGHSTGEGAKISSAYRICSELDAGFRNSLSGKYGF